MIIYTALKIASLSGIEFDIIIFLLDTDNMKQKAREWGEKIRAGEQND